VVFIRGGKGRKDRQSIMAQSLMPLLEKYMAEFNPKFWLFEGQTGEQYSATSVLTP
jgi:site-specific recombinase XerD